MPDRQIMYDFTVPPLQDQGFICVCLRPELFHPACHYKLLRRGVDLVTESSITSTIYLQRQMPASHTALLDPHQFLGARRPALAVLLHIFALKVLSVPEKFAHAVCKIVEDCAVQSILTSGHGKKGTIKSYCSCVISFNC